jgi:translation initiation factor IF-2
MVKSQMSEQGLIPEERGGDIPFIALSSVTWEWVDELLEYILLQAEMLELKYNPKAPAVWVVLESSKDPKAWTIATLLVMTWTLKKRDPIIAYNVYGKIKLMKDWIWKIVREVKWWDPVQVMWFETVPQSWRIFEVVNSEKEAQKQVEKIRDMIKKTEQKSILSNFLDKMKAWETVELKVVLKAWDFGWLEALKYAMNKVKLPEGVKLKIIHEEVWHVKESDVTLAEASWAFIFGFDSAINSSLKKKLEQKKVTFKNFTIIYELLDYIEKLATWMIEKEAEEVYVWQLEVLAIFYKKWNDMIIWWKVIDGLVKNWAHFMLRRWEDELWWWKVTSVKIEQENVSEVKSWRECWIRVRTGKKIKEWDILEFYIYEKQ